MNQKVKFIIIQTINVQCLLLQIPKLVPKDDDVLSGDDTSNNRQRRRAAINSLVNIARFTGRVADETVENQLLIARNLKKKATAMMRREVQMNYANKKDLVRLSMGEDTVIKNVKTDAKRGLFKNVSGDCKTNSIMSAKENLNSGKHLLCLHQIVYESNYLS